MIDPTQLKQHVITPVLTDLGLYSDAAVNLLLLTTAAESEGGRYLHQIGSGPAVGIYQMEPATHEDCWVNFLHYRPELRDNVIEWRRHGAPTGDKPDSADEMAGNLFYATAMCRVKYLRVPEALPGKNDKKGLANYYLKYYNTYLGKAKFEKVLDDYEKYTTRSRKALDW